MKIEILLLLVLQIFLGKSYGQIIRSKPPLDIQAVINWPTLTGLTISNDNRYALYTINNKPVGKQSLVVRQLSSDWELTIECILNATFLKNSPGVILLKEKDSLCVVSLENKMSQNVDVVESFQYFSFNRIDYVIYKLKEKNEVCIKNISSGERFSYNDFSKYFINNSGKIILEKESETKDENLRSLYLLKLQNGEIREIFAGYNISNLVFDESGEQLLFMSTAQKDKTNLLWLYNDKVGNLVDLSNIFSRDSNNLVKLNRIRGFTNDGNRALFEYHNDTKIHEDPMLARVDIWNYKDYKLQSQQIIELSPKPKLGILNLEDRKVFLLQRDNEQIRFFNSIYDDFAFVTDSKEDRGDRYWNNRSLAVGCMESTFTGERKPVNLRIISLSPLRKYGIGFDSLFTDLYSYNTSTGEVQNITKLLPIPAYDSEYDMPMKNVRSLIDSEMWLGSDSLALIYDKFDIWAIDPKGFQSPICLTKGYGRKNNIVFRIMNTEVRNIKGKSLILTAFDKGNKNSGFFKIDIDGKKNPVLLTMKPVKFSIIKILNSVSSTDTVIVVDSPMVILSIMGSNKSPNYYSTKDFISFNPISKVYPEANFNWLSNDLITWKNSTGETIQGIIYKPEDFSPLRKYPVIVNYYEVSSDKLNDFDTPELSGGWLNISWFVSQGYIVFVPDVHFKIGDPGYSSLNSVISGVKYISQFKWIDSKRIAIHGHSWGGFQTNYIITHSNIFRAATSSAGISDLISIYGSTIPRTGNSFQFFIQKDQGRMGSSLWDNPKAYINNSAVFKASAVVTPLLMLNNKMDAIIPFSQGVEFFTALRRLGKKVWMLQYDDEAHILLNEVACEDFTMRLNQFYNYYLKGANPPSWMTKGVHAKFKGVKTGLELDSTSQP